MTFFYKISTLLFLMVASGCDSTKSTAKEDAASEKTSTVMNEKMVNEGYSEGTITYSKNSKCPVIIIKEDTKEQLDPINMDDSKFVSFKNDGNKIYFKFRRLRMMNRCDEALPISLEEVKTKE